MALDLKCKCGHNRQDHFHSQLECERCECGEFQLNTDINITLNYQDDTFYKLIEEIKFLHDKKRQDYGQEGDPLANVRASQQFGVSPWLGAIIRLNDKVTRIGSFAKKGVLANESIEDSMMDIAVYALIALQLYREEKANAG